MYILGLDTDNAGGMIYTQTNLKELFVVLLFRC